MAVGKWGVRRIRRGPARPWGGKKWEQRYPKPRALWECWGLGARGAVLGTKQGAETGGAEAGPRGQGLSGTQRQGLTPCQVRECRTKREVKQSHC